MPQTLKEVNDVFKRFGCVVHSLSYNFHDQELKLNLSRGHCVDMNKAINFAIDIDPNVKCIQTLNGEVLDTCYALVDGEWTVIR